MLISSQLYHGDQGLEIVHYSSLNRMWCKIYLCGAMHFKFFSPVLPLFIVYDPIINHRLNLNEKIMNLIIA
jgi:hypothetical protein